MAAALAVRVRVFVDEQQVPAEEEVDEHDRTDPNARHAVSLTIKSPKVWASAGVGAVAGAPLGPVGALAGGLIGGLVAKHGIAGNPVGRAMDWAKTKLTKKAP